MSCDFTTVLIKVDHMLWANKKATTSLQDVLDQDGFLYDNSCPAKKVYDTWDLKTMLV